MKLINWILKKLIAKERKRQIEKGYTLSHDVAELHKYPNHLLDEAREYYESGRPIAALALLEAQLDADHFLRIFGTYEH